MQRAGAAMTAVTAELVRPRPIAAPLAGLPMIIAAVAIGAGNFLVVLDSTITNVSVPTIAGALGVSANQGTWVITSYAVAEAISVPLTGWLAKTFGAQRVFITCYLAFAAVSLFCGLSSSLGMLIFGRVLLGLVGGPIMPLSQMMLLRIFPKEKATLGTVIFGMTTLVGPIAGPILGGIICDDAGWSWIFFLTAPFALGGGLVLLSSLRGQPDPKAKSSIDMVGLGLLIVWVGALQILLDEGRDLDWFASTEIRLLAVVAALGFVSFLIWVLTDANPIVDLRVFRHRGFAAATATYAIGFAAFFATIVIIPLWLQQNLGYTATWAGYSTGILGILAVMSAPMVGKALEKIDARALISVGFLGLGLINVWRMGFNSNVTFLQMALPTLLCGPFMVMFFLPLSGLVVASVDHDEQANAAGLSNFMRTLGGAFATSMVQTGWSDAARSSQTELAGEMVNGGQMIQQFEAGGVSHEGAVALLTSLVEGQSVMLATLKIFGVVAIMFFGSALLIWIAPKPKGPIDASAGH
jgi:DHA2 family multidrug resistance protein